MTWHTQGDLDGKRINQPGKHYITKLAVIHYNLKIFKKEKSIKLKVEK